MPERTLTLSQVVGNLKQAREASNRAGIMLRGGLKDQHVTGLNRTFTPDDEEKRLLQKNADEYKAVPLKVMDQIAEDAAVSAKALDWALTQDVANCSAKADVVVDGGPLLTQVPISHLLHLEKVFSEYKAVILHPGTDKHAPQAVLDARESHIGDWETVVQSGAVSEEQKRQLLTRADTLIAALKDAIAVADHTPASKLAAGDKLFGFLLGQDLR